MKQPKSKLSFGFAILGLVYMIMYSVFARLYNFHAIIFNLNAYRHGLNLVRAFISAKIGTILAVAAKENPTALASHRTFSPIVWQSIKFKFQRFMWLLLATSVCTYLPSQSGAIAQDIPQISLGYTMINGRIGPLEATEGEIALVYVQSDKNVSSALDVTVNVTQTGNFVGIVPDKVPYRTPFKHGVLGKNTVTIPVGKKVAIFGIAFTDDKIHEDDGTVSVSLAREPTYSVKLEPLSARQKTFSLQDDEPEPIFSIETNSTTVSDTDSFEVRVTSNIESENQYAINLSISSLLSGLITSGNQSATINFPALTTTQSHSINVAEIATSTTDGHPVSVSIDNSDSYNVNGSKRLIQVNVIDGGNLPTLAIAAGSASVSEGSPASFTITNTSASASEIPINLKISSTGDSLYRIPYDTIELPANTPSVAYVLPTESDGQTTGPAGRITVTLEPSKYYKIGTQKFAEVTITNDGSTQVPILYIDNKVGNNRVINSVEVSSTGAMAEFTVFSNVNPGTNFTVSSQAENIDGAFLGTISNTNPTINFSEVENTGIYSGTLQIPVVQDANRKSGVVQVTLIDPTNLTYSVHKVHKSATMRVIKDSSSLPVISITGGGGFEEGQDGVFYLQADRAPSSAIQVTVALTDPELFLLSRSNRTVEISSTNPVPLYLPTDGDSNLDTDNTITATIQADPAATDTYEVNSVNNSATISVYDNDDLNFPSVQISGTGSSTEGSTVGFRITVSPTPSQPLDVDIDILREGDFFPDEIDSKLTKKTVTVPTTGTLVYLERTVSDAVDEPHGKITVTIRTSTINPTSYSVRSQFRHSTTIQDNDYADTPAVSIVAGGDIIEGENAFFTISTNEPIATALPVGISIAYKGEFFSQTGVQTPTITLPISIAGEGEKATSSYIYHIPTLYDMEDEEDGHVIISIQNDSDPTPRYSIGANSIATVIVKDDDEPNPASGNEQRPVISIFSNFTETGVTINYPVNITVVSSKRVENDMLVLVHGERTNENIPFFQGSVPTVTRYIRIRKGDSRASISFQFENCSSCNSSKPADSYVFTVQNQTHLYLVNEQYKRVVINVKNNNSTQTTLPIISIAPTNSNSIIEGKIASFTLTSNQPITEDLKINYWISNYPLYTSDNMYGLRSVSFSADRSAPYTHILEIDTKVHNDELDMTLTIQIRDGQGYVRSPNTNKNSASIAVNDIKHYNLARPPNLTNEQGALTKPVVSVTALTPTVSELEVAGFEISVRNPITSTIENGRIVNRVENSRPVLVRFKLVEFGSAIPSYLKRPSRADSSSDTTFNERLSRFEEGFNEIAESFYGCQIHPNLEFSCWINNRRNFGIRTFDGSGERAISLKILGISERYFSDYFVDRSKAAATLFIRDQKLPVITINPSQVSINTNIGSSSYAEFQLSSNGNTANISTKIMLQVDDPRGIVTGINSSTDRLEHTTDNLFKPGRPYELILEPRNDGRFIVDFHSIQSVLSADAFITVRILPAQSSDKYVVGSPSAATLFTNAQSTSANGVSIFAASESAKSGEPVFFNIKSKNNFSSPTTVNISLDQGDGNIIAGNEGLTRQLSFRANTKSQYLRVDTHELAPNSKTESITATLQSGSGYTIVSAHNSAKTTLTSFQQHLIATVKNVTGSNGGTLVTENGVTESAATYIVEGEIAYFEFTLSLPRKNLTLSNRNKITSYQMPKEGIVLDFEVQDTNNFIFSDSSNNIDYAYSIHFPYREFLPNNVFESGSDTDPIVFTKVIFPLQTQVVAGYNFGPLSITIGNDPTGGRLYQAAASPNNSASIAIRDNGLSAPEISIQRGTDPNTGQEINTITEGEQLRAVISLSIQAGYQFYVQLKATEIGNFLNVGRDGKNFNLEIGLGTNQRDFIPVIFDDDVEEENGEVRFTVMPGAGYTVNSNQNKVDFDIMDNDGAPTIGFGVTDSIGEGVGNAEIVVTLSNPTEMAVNFKYITMTGTATASEDYTEIVAAAPATGTFEKGHTTIMIPVAITDDRVDEADENFVVRITEVTNGSFAGSATFIEQTFTIADNDEFPVIGISDPVTVNEAAGFIEIEVTISEMSEQIVGFSYITENNSAFARSDFTGISTGTPASGMISVGTSNSSIRIPIRNDDLAEQSEDFVVKITGLTNARFPDDLDSVETIVTIIDNDEVSISIADASAFEGDTGTKAMVFVVSLSAVATRTVSVTWSTYVFDLQDTATPGEDFIETTNNTLEFAPRETSKSIAVTIMGDTEEESNESFTVGLTNPSTGSIIAINAATGLIVSDDGNANPLIILSAGSSATEGVTAQFIFSANPSVTLPVDVHYNVAIDGNFVLWRIKRTVTLTESSGVLRIKTHDDDIDEPDGSISVTLVATQHYQILDGLDSRKITISDNDLAPDDPNRIEPDPRVSVASTAANAIIDFLGASTPESTQLNESASILPIVSIQASNPIVNEGDLVEFALISSSRSETFEISVKLHVNPVGAFFEFDVPKQISVRIQGSTSVPVSFQTIDDTIAEDDGRLEVSIIADPTYQIVTDQSSASVAISDAVDRNERQDLLLASAEAFLPEVVGNLAARTTDIISQRVQQGFNQSKDLALNLGGEETIKGIIELSGQMTNEGFIAWQEILGDSSFAFTLLTGEDFTAPTTIWGIGDHRDLSSNSSENIHNWSGTAFTGQIGIDTLIGEEVLTGISASVSENDIEIDDTSGTELEFSLNSTSINPYIGWTSPSQDAVVRATAGYGVGELTIDQSNYDIETLASTSYSMALAGRKEFDFPNTIFNGITKLSVIGDSWFARQFLNGQENLLTNLQTDAHYYNVKTKGTHQLEFESGTALTPFISAGFRGDRKNQHSTLAMEFTSGFDFVTPVGLTINGSGQMLVANSNTIQSISSNSTFGYDYGNDELGLTLEISPTWGQSQTNAQNSLWSSNILASDSEFGLYSNGTQVNSKIGYGFTLGANSRKLTIYGGYLFDDQIEDELLLGSSLIIGSNFGLDLEGINKLSTNEVESSKLQLNGRMNW